MNSKVIYRLLAWLLLSVMCICQCTGFAASAQETVSREGVLGKEDVQKVSGQQVQAMGGKVFASELNNPVIEEDSSMNAKQKVTWDCVWFGSYPQAEVVDSKEMYMGIDGKFLRDRDLIEDSGLYNTLEHTVGWDADNDIVLDGKRYHRIKKEDATHASGSSPYYSWQGTYHYFKYEPIKWRVLKVAEGQALILSDVALDDQAYNTESAVTTWETSTIRSWLNGYGSSFNQQGIDYTSKSFINSAFSSAQKSAIMDTDTIKTSSVSVQTEGKSGTNDKIFLLSEAEVYGDGAVEYGFVSDEWTDDEARSCKSSAYAKTMGIFSRSGGTDTGNCYWWFCTSGEGLKSTGRVSYSGNIGNDTVNSVYVGVRAVLNLNLFSGQWSYAGTVCSDGTEDEKAYGMDGNEEEGYKSLQDAAVTFAEHGDIYYTGQPQCPAFTVSYDGKQLAEGKDYSVSCTNNINPSFDPYCYDCYGGIYDSENRSEYAKISITGIYPYKDTIERYFRICGFSDLTATRGFIWNYGYTGEEICPKPQIVLYNDGEIGDVLAENVDYSLSYYDNTEPGKATILVAGIGKYQGYGSYHVHFFISEKDISECEALLSTDGETYEKELSEDAYTADGKAKTPYVHVTWAIQKDGSYEPIDSSYYDVAYENNVNAGTATVRITGKSPYTGSLTKTFKIGQGKASDDNGVNSFTYQFGNTRSDFGYASDYTIDEESIFTKLWGNTALAQQNYNYWTRNFKTWCGNCYGMSATSIMFRDNRDDIEVSGFNSKASLVKELELDDYNRNSNIRMSLLDFIEVMQVSQIDETVSHLIGKTNKGRINWLCNALKSAEEENTAILIVLDSNGPQGAHAVVGYHMEDISETERRIYIYDCNHPNVSRYITLTMDQDTCTGWRYDGGNESQSMLWTSEKMGDVSCTISYISYDSFVKVWLNRSLGEKPVSERNVMTLNVANASICDKDGQEVAVLENGEIRSENEEIFAYYPVCATLDGNYDKSEMQPVIYLPTDEYVVKNTDKKVDELKLTMCNVDRKMEVITSAASVSVNVSDAGRVNMIQVEGEEEKVEANFYSSDSSEQYKTMNYIGHVIGSSSMMLGSADGEKIVQNFNVTSEKVENKEPVPDGNPGDKKVDPDVKEDDSNGKKDDSDGTNKNPGYNKENPADNVSFKLISSTGSIKIAAGKKVKLTAITMPQNAGNQKLSYSSANKKVATVNKKGIVSVKKNAGGKSVVITAVSKTGCKASVKLKIMKGAVKKIGITGKKSCKAGKSLKLKAKVTAGKGANKSVVWKSSNTRYAEVTKNGTVKTKKEGKGKKVKITAMATDGSGKKGSIQLKIN